MSSRLTREAWAGVERDDHEPAEVFRQSAPQSLYRYRSLAGEQCGFAEEIITTSRFFWPTPADFNDPFEFAPLITVPSGIKLQSALRKVRARQRLIIGKVQADAMCAELMSLSRPQLIERVRQSMQTTARQVGVLCYSEINNSVLMWGHYADCHRGICLEYDPHCVAVEPSNMLYKVRYQDERPIVARFLEREDSGELAKALTTKARYWEYEQEWRAIENHGAKQKIPFSAQALTGVILGSRISPAHEGLVRKWCAARAHPPKISRAVPSVSCFGIDIVPA